VGNQKDMGVGVTWAEKQTKKGKLIWTGGASGVENDGQGDRKWGHSTEKKGTGAREGKIKQGWDPVLSAVGVGGKVGMTNGVGSGVLSNFLVVFWGGGGVVVGGGGSPGRNLIYIKSYTSTSSSGEGKVISAYPNLGPKKNLAPAGEIEKRGCPRKVGWGHNQGW